MVHQNYELSQEGAANDIVQTEDYEQSENSSVYVMNYGESGIGNLNNYDSTPLSNISASKILIEGRK